MRIKLTTYYHADQVPPLPEGSTFHSTALMRIYEATPGYRPFMVVATDEGRPVARLLAVVRQSHRHWLPNLIRRCEVFGCGDYFDPPVSQEELFGQMLERITAEALTDSWLIEFRDLSHPLFGYKHFIRQGYFPIRWMRVYNSLHSVEWVEDRFYSSRLRQVRRAQRRGVTVSQAHDSAEVERFSAMLHANYSFKIRRHFPDEQFFHHLIQRWEKEATRARIFTVNQGERLIGGAVCIYSGSTAYLWFSGGLTKRYVLESPVVMAIWGAMADAKRRGYEHFEFMDVGLPFQRHGYRQFVLRFGGKTVSTRRWFQSRWPCLNRILCRWIE